MILHDALKARNGCCTGKWAFDERLAVREAKRHTTQRGVPKEAYDCPFCGLFHIGRRVSPSRRRMLEEAAKILAATPTH
jgi:hypothetical protein